MPVDVLLVFLVIILLLGAVLFFRAMMYGKAPQSVVPMELPEVDEAAIAQSLSNAIKIQSVSDMTRSMMEERTAFAFHQFLEHQYPRLHAALTQEVVNGRALLYTWLGEDPAQEAVLLAAHFDVVPADPATAAAWTHAPFDGVIEEGFVWGRGALDMKSTLITVLEAVEALVERGYRPQRTLYLAFGHDEEIGGKHGAAAIAALLQSRDVKLSVVLDEGGFITSGLLDGLKLPVALVGIAEKGHLTLELSVEGRAGHSAAPPPHTAVGVLARAIARLEAAPLPARLSLAGLMFDEVGGFLPLGLRLGLANRFLFNSLILKRLADAPLTNALIRTTTAVTMISGGIKDNILPAQARAAVNFRLLPGDSIGDVVGFVKSVISDDAVQIKVAEDAAWEASFVSPTDSAPYAVLTETIRRLYPEALVAPFLVIGATDSRYYENLTQSIYRFSPYLLDDALLRTIHGIDERIETSTLARMTQFYSVLLQQWLK